MPASASRCGSTKSAPGPGSVDIALRLEEARAALSSCQLCEWRCGVDRTKGEPAPCRLNADTYIFRRYVSLTDELEIIPTLRAYFSGCNFRCRFCDTAPTCFEPSAGERVNPQQLADELVAAVRHGAKTIDLLGGEPSLHPHISPNGVRPRGRRRCPLHELFCESCPGKILPAARPE